MAKRANYDAASIQWLKGAEGIRANSAYYLGTTGNMAVRQMPIEVVGNSIDEAGSGHGDTVILKVDKTNTVTVWDFGRGIPVGKHPDHPDRDVIDLLFTELHTGGKKGNQTGYEEGTVGTHGVGLTVVNALSSRLDVWTFAKGSTPYHTWFEAGERQTKVAKASTYPQPPVLKDRRPGTIVQFKIDMKVFEARDRLDYASLLDWVREASWFAYHKRSRGSKLVERRHVTFVCIGPDGKAVKVRRKGLDEYYFAQLDKLKAQPVGFEAPLTFNTPNLDIVLGWSSHDEETIRCYTNSIINEHGGTHQRAFLKLIDSVFRKYAKNSQRYKVTDLMVGAIGCINVRIKAPRFDSQSKSKLVSDNVGELVETQARPIMEKWARQNAAQVRELVERACEMAKLQSQLKDDKKLVAALKVKKGGKLLLPPKLLVSHTKNPQERELFLVEGDSAKGGCDVASDRRYQEILPMRGKLSNVLRESKEKRKKAKDAGVSETIVDILKATGITPAEGTKNMRVGKIMILTDADTDGSHISSLLLGMFSKYAPELFEEGKVFFVDTPLFVHQSRTGVKNYARSYEALAEKMGDKLHSAGSTLTRAKGLGELNPDVLEHVVFNPATRRLIQLDTEAVRNKLVKIMGDDGSVRRQMLGIGGGETAETPADEAE